MQYKSKIPWVRQAVCEQKDAVGWQCLHCPCWCCSLWWNSEGQGCSFSHQLQQKVVTSAVFSGKKEGYLESLSQPFLETRLSECSKPLQASATSSWLCEFLPDQTDSFSKRNSLLAEAASPATGVPPCNIQ